MHYKFCPECGAKLVDKQAGDDGAVPYCCECKRFWFDSFSSCVIVMVVNELHEIALLHQSYISDEYETFVAGFMTPGESAELAAVREVKEELGLTIDKLEYAGTHWFDKREQLMHAFIGYVRKAPFVLSQEVDSASWVSLADAPGRMFPDRPGNTQHIIYRQYCKSIKRVHANDDDFVVDIKALHTTPLGEQRVRRNLAVPDSVDVVDFCRNLIRKDSAVVKCCGKNVYVSVDDCCITINRGSQTIITAHK